MAMTSQPESKYNSSRYRHYVLFLLCGVYGLNFLDRQILNILIDPIQAELGISNTAMGLLTGFGFSIFYVLFGIPIARWADLGERRLIVTIGLSIWSLATALSGFAQHYWQLACARVFVAIGESGGTSPSSSMIADYFPRADRARAMSIFQTSIYVGVLFGYLFGGWISEWYGWRAAFMIAGLPGLALAAVLYFTVREPQRGMSEARPVDPRPLTIRESLSFILSQRSLVLLTLGSVLIAASNFGFGAWVPTFLRRVHHLSGGELGTWLGFAGGLGGCAGTLLGGFLVGRLKPGSESWTLRLPALTTLCAAPVLATFLLAPSVATAMLAYAIGSALTAMQLGPVAALVQSLSRVRARTLTAAVINMLCILIGGGMGPTFVGVMTDGFTSSFGPEAVRWALMATVPAVVLAALCFLAGSFFIRRDLDCAEHADAAPAPSR
ncbi:MAG TPA: MFS transporter [Steroidobacter sp.]|uniref:spinster family MFS transporter n=1 Tax=Steroidobacter sp. TaxID=1978227 RepID=UPI002ED77C3B